MRAVIAHQSGPPDVLQAVDLPDPEPAAGQVLVAVAVAAITFIDTQVRAGTSPRPLEPDAFPQALHHAARGAIRPTIGQTYPLDQASLAHTAIEARTTFGKTLLTP
jgi:NADPH:quinone reductase-like Zn-dependent oxidoreductase